MKKLSMLLMSLMLLIAMPVFAVSTDSQWCIKVINQANLTDASSKVQNVAIVVLASNSSFSEFSNLSQIIPEQSQTNYCSDIEGNVNFIVFLPNNGGKSYECSIDPVIHVALYSSLIVGRVNQFGNIQCTVQ